MKTVIPPVLPRLCANEVVVINGNRYRAEFWNSHNAYYEFINVGDKDLPNFTRTEQQVSDALISKKIKRIS